MTNLEFNADTFSYMGSIKLFTVSELDIPKFDTSYRLWNPITKHGKVFEFTHSTGGEFEPDTKFVYESEDGIKLEVVNDPERTQDRKNLYVNTKHL
jgi:hypothetical protein